MKGKEFIESKWVKQAEKEENQRLIKEKFGKWSTRVSNTGLLKKAKQLYQFFLSSEITGIQKTLVAAALLYVISPLDLVPDWIPVAGWFDDMGIASFILNYIFSQMDKVEECEQIKMLTESELLENEIEGTASETNNFDFNTPVNSIVLHPNYQTKALENKLDELAIIANTLEINGADKFLGNLEEKVSSSCFLKFAIVGRYSTGKSTLINSLLGKELLPTSPIPTTKAITYLLKGKNDMLFLEYIDETVEIVENIDCISSIYKDKSNSIKKMTISLSDFPIDNLTIIDTPGLEEPDQEIAQLTLNMVPETDAVVVLLDANYLESKVEFEFMSSLLINDKDRSIFVVINKVDDMSQEEIDILKNKCQSLLNQYKIINAHLYTISAIKADADQGFASFKKELYEFLFNDIQKEAKRHIESQLQSYTTFMLDSCNLALINASQKDHLFSEESIKIGKKIKELNLEYSKQKHLIERKIKGYRTQFKFDFSNFIDSLKASLRQEIMVAKLSTLKNTDDIAFKTKQQIVNFVDEKINEINIKLYADMSASQEEIRNFLSQLELPIDIQFKDYSSYSHLFLPVAVATSYFFGGFFSCIWVIIAAVIGRNFFESAITEFIEKVGINHIREKLLETLLPQIEQSKKKLEVKLDEAFDMMEKEILSSYDMACANASEPLKFSLPNPPVSVNNVKDCREKLIEIIK